MRHFTVDEANAMLPMLTQILEDLRAKNRRFRELIELVRAFEGMATGNGHTRDGEVLDPQNDIRTLQGELQQRLQYLQELGVLIKDIENGVIDFPTRMRGQDVYLCWQLGEDRVRYWHETDVGFAGRRLL